MQCCLHLGQTFNQHSQILDPNRYQFNGHSTERPPKSTSLTKPFNLFLSHKAIMWFAEAIHQSKVALWLFLNPKLREDDEKEEESNCFLKILQINTFPFHPWFLVAFFCVYILVRCMSCSSWERSVSQSPTKRTWLESLRALWVPLLMLSGMNFMNKDFNFTAFGFTAHAADSPHDKWSSALRAAYPCSLACSLYHHCAPTTNSPHHKICLFMATS